MSSLFMTGASGFIGYQFLSHYAGQFERVILPLRKRPEFELPENVSVQFVQGHADEIADCLLQTPCSHVLNAAAYGITPTARNPKDMMAVNTDIPVQLAKAAQKIGAKKFVQLGTMSEYQLLDRPRKTLELDKLMSETESYGGSKAQASRELEVLSGAGPTKITCLRLFGVYGPGEGPHRLVVSLFNKLTSGEVAPMSAGTQVRDFIYISDVTSAIYQALNSKIENQFSVFNIGSGIGISVADFARALCRAANFPEENLDFGALPMRDTDVPYIVADIEAAKRQLGWSPEHTPELALEEYVRHLNNLA